MSSKRKPVTCERCGLESATRSGAHASPLCADCRAVLSVAERAAWSRKPVAA